MSNITHVHSPVVLHHISISACSYDSPAAIQISKDFLSGWSGDYFFFQVDDGYYCLILTDDVTSVTVDGYTSSFACTSGTVYDIWIDEDIDSQSLDYSGRVSGSFTGASPAPSAGSWSGTSSGSVDLDSSVYSYYYSVRTAQNVSIYNPAGCLCYSSLDGFPHLVEMGCYYAFAAFVFAAAVVAFKLCNRIFSRVY